MHQLIKLHLGLTKYLRVELKKKRNLIQLILFFKQLLKIYFKELLKIYKNLFDLDYKKQQKEYNKYTQLKKDLQRALKLLNYLDIQMQKAGLNRQRRRRFWQEFYKYGQVRKEVFDNLLKEINQLGG